MQSTWHWAKEIIPEVWNHRIACACAKQVACKNWQKLGNNLGLTAGGHMMLAFFYHTISFFWTTVKNIITTNSVKLFTQPKKHYAIQKDMTSMFSRSMSTKKTSNEIRVIGVPWVGQCQHCLVESQLDGAARPAPPRQEVWITIYSTSKQRQMDTYCSA